MGIEFKFSQHKNFMAIIDGGKVQIKGNEILIETTIKDIEEMELFIKNKFIEYEKILMEKSDKNKNLDSFLINNFLENGGDLEAKHLKTFLFLLKKMDSTQKKIYGAHETIEKIEKYITTTRNFNPFEKTS